MQTKMGAPVTLYRIRFFPSLTPLLSPIYTPPPHSPSSFPFPPPPPPTPQAFRLGAAAYDFWRGEDRRDGITPLVDSMRSPGTPPAIISRQAPDTLPAMHRARLADHEHALRPTEDSCPPVSTDFRRKLESTRSRCTNVDYSHFDQILEGLNVHLIRYQSLNPPFGGLSYPVGNVAFHSARLLRFRIPGRLLR